jgi:hypothetical protein
MPGEEGTEPDTDEEEEEETQDEMFPKPAISPTTTEPIEDFMDVWAEVKDLKSRYEDVKAIENYVNRKIRDMAKEITVEYKDGEISRKWLKSLTEDQWTTDSKTRILAKILLEQGEILREYRTLFSDSGETVNILELATKKITKHYKKLAEMDVKKIA